MNEFYAATQPKAAPEPDKTAEKAEFKLTLIKLGVFGIVTVLNFYFLMYIFLYPAAWLIRAMGEGLSYELWYLINWAANELCVYFFPVLTLFLLFRKDFKAPNRYGRMTRNECLFAMPLIFLSSTFIGSMATIVTKMAASAMDKIFGTGEIPDAMAPSMPAEGEGASMWIAMVFLVIAAPVCEELMVRKLILYPLRKHGDWFAIITSALIFGFIHGNLDQLPYAFAVGILYGLLAVQANSVIPTMILHAVNNLMVTLGSYLTTVTGEVEPFVSISAWSAYVMNMCFWLGIAAFAILIAVKFHKSRRTPVLTVGEKMTEIVKNPAAYVFAATLVMLLVL